MVAVGPFFRAGDGKNALQLSGQIQPGRVHGIGVAGKGYFGGLFLLDIAGKGRH